VCEAGMWPRGISLWRTSNPVSPSVDSWIGTYSPFGMLVVFVHSQPRGARPERCSRTRDMDFKFSLAGELANDCDWYWCGPLDRAAVGPKVQARVCLMPSRRYGGLLWT
jgi:hypothetical protein